MSKRADDPVRVKYAREITKSVQGDESLKSWADKLIQQADDFLKNRKPDPLDSFLPS